MHLQGKKGRKWDWSQHMRSGVKKKSTKIFQQSNCENAQSQNTRIPSSRTGIVKLAIFPTLSTFQTAAVSNSPPTLLKYDQNQLGKIASGSHKMGEFSAEILQT
jgi:hypothetical protein